MEKEIELKSEPMNEMLSHPPKWIVRSGNGLFLLVLFIVLGLAWVIEYPDEISGDVSVTTIAPPIELSNQSYVQLKNISVQDQQLVKKGQLLVAFDNKANTTDVEKAKAYLASTKNWDFNQLGILPEMESNLQLGTYQESWLNLQTQLLNWNELQTSNLLKVKIKSLEKEVEYRKRLQTIASKKIKLTEQDYALIHEEVVASERLAKENAISKQNLNQEKKAESQALQSVENHKEQSVQNLIQLNALKKEIVQLKHDVEQEEQKNKSQLRISIASLDNSFNDWNKNAIWTAPCDGKVLFNAHLQANKFYSANKASLVIVPKGSDYIGLAIIPNRGAGKIKKGQVAFIELADFPKIEYGVIEAKVAHITQIAKDGNYEVQLLLPKNFKTSYQKNIPMKAEMKGTVKVITKNKRLIERFFEKIIDLL